MTLMGRVMTFLTVLGGMMKGIEYIGSEAKGRQGRNWRRIQRGSCLSTTKSDGCGVVGLDRVCDATMLQMDGVAVVFVAWR
jgi:hypothetical protein